jgi:hypothetical protein
MKTTHIALIWGAIIIATAIYTNYIGLSDAASTGITMGMVGAAWGSIQGKSGRCSKVCR